MTPLEALERRLEPLDEEVIRWRRHLHAHPELSYQEHLTSQFIVDRLGEMAHVEISRPTDTSVVGRIRGSGEGPVIALRADTDALPIQETSGVECQSTVPHVMHACGHDGHTAMLLGVAKALSHDTASLRGEVRLIFQHSEEVPPGGAQELVAHGVLDGVSTVLGMHLDANIDTGRLAIQAGPIMAACDEFTITIVGRGGHAAYPHFAVDSVAVGAQVVTNLQHLVSRETDAQAALVVTVTQFTAGQADNVIPPTAELLGTVRCFDEGIREAARLSIERIVNGVTRAHGATYELDYRRGYAAVVNDGPTVALVEAAVSKMPRCSVTTVSPHMGSEDFSAYLAKVPGVFFFVGAHDPASDVTYRHHDPGFTIDEAALGVGTRAVTAGLFALQSLA